MFGRTVQTASKKINAGGVETSVRGQRTANQNEYKSTKNLTLSNMLNDAERILIQLPPLSSCIACMHVYLLQRIVFALRACSRCTRISFPSANVANDLVA